MAGVEFRRFKEAEPVEQKNKLQAELNKHIQEYIKNGGKIHSVGDTETAAKHLDLKASSRKDTDALQAYVDTIDSIQVRFAAMKNQYELYVDGIYINSYDSRHKANGIGKKMYESTLKKGK